MYYRECESGDHAQKGEDEPKVDTNNPLIELFQGKIVQVCSWVHKATGTLGLKKIL